MTGKSEENEEGFHWIPANRQTKRRRFITRSSKEHLNVRKTFVFACTIITRNACIVV